VSSDVVRGDEIANTAAYVGFSRIFLLRYVFISRSALKG
jgi:hypothetical protein